MLVELNYDPKYGIYSFYNTKTFVKSKIVKKNIKNKNNRQMIDQSRLLTINRIDRKLGESIQAILIILPERANLK